MKNVEFLKDQMKYTGFGEGYETQLKEKIGKGLPEFQISHRAEYGNDVVTATLDFSKSKNSDMYFFNSYKIDMKPEGSNELMSQSFQIGTRNNITLKEAYNMMNGRSIYKEFNKVEKQGEGESARFAPTDEKYQAWKQMNFKETTKNGNFKLDTFTDAYGFKLQDELCKLPLKELQDKVANQRLIESLEKGNRPLVTLIQDGNERQHYLVANPKFKRIDVYDNALQKVDMTQGQKAEKKESQQENLAGEKKTRKSNAKKNAVA
ncbi:MAG: hypothetical protein V4594_18605 [Bacteroidota bacterium]